MKPAFYIYHEDMEAVEDLTDEELGMLLRLLNAYSKGEDVDVPASLKFPFRFMAMKIEKDATAYQDKVNKSKKAAEKRWQKDADESDSMPPHTDDIQTDADACERMQTQVTKLNQTKLNQTKPNIKTITPAARESDFNEIWDVYPRKEGKSQAFEAYKRAIHNGISKDTILQGAKRYAEYCKVKQTETRYIKQGSTWFRNKCWEDVLDFSSPKQERPDMQFLQRSDAMEGVLADL